MECERNWKPKRLERVIEYLPNSTLPMLVKTDQGMAVMKAMGNPAGDSALAFDLIGTELARLLGLNTPDFSLIDTSGLPPTWGASFVIEPGPAFLSKFLDAATFDSPLLLKHLKAPQDLALLVAFDTWIRNEDRFPLQDAEEKPQNLDNLLFVRNAREHVLSYDLFVIDQTHAFSIGDPDEAASETWATASGVYGLFPDFLPYMEEEMIRNAAEKLRDVNATEVAAIFESVPSEWGLTRSLRTKICQNVLARALFVSDTIENEILDQKVMQLRKEDK